LGSADDAGRRQGQSRRGRQAPEPDRPGDGGPEAPHRVSPSLRIGPRQLAGGVEQGSVGEGVRQVGIVQELGVMTYLHSIESNFLPAPMREAVSLAWSLFSRKVGGDLIKINKEASMQLQFGYILQQILPLITFQRDEQLWLELETSAKVDTTSCEIDVLLSGESIGAKHRIAVELKCYK